METLSAAGSPGQSETVEADECPAESCEFVINPDDKYTVFIDTTKSEEGPKPEETPYLLYDDGSVKCFLVAEDDVESSAIEDAKIVEKKPKNHVCPMPGCGRAYSSAHHLKVHERLHTGVRPYKCTADGCNRDFNSDYSRKAHERTHTGEKPYVCDFSECQKGFKTSGDLQKHRRTHTGERPFLCPYEGCEKSFTTSHICRIHLRTHTGEKPYVCQQDGCKKIFASSANYKNHLRIHTGERPYACQVPGCDRKFTEYSSLYKHRLVHSRTKRFKCGFCSKSYRQMSSLTAHTRTAHGTSYLLVGSDDDAAEILTEPTVDSSPGVVDEQLVISALDNYFDV